MADSTAYPTHPAKRGHDAKAEALAAQLAVQVIEQIRAQKLAIGSHLTERGLAEGLRVSRTPIRGALRFLEEMGVVERAPNRGYFLKKAAEGLPNAAAAHREDELYLRIAEDRLEGRLPARITEAELMRRYDCPRTRLMPMLTRMQHEGWVERLPGKGWEFQTVLDSPAVYEQSYRFRMLIEPPALLEPTYRIDPNAFAGIRTQQNDMLNGQLLQYSRVEIFEAGARFHETIIGCSGNAFIVDALQRINRLRRLIEYRINLDRGRLVQQCKEHLALLDLIESGQRFAAANFLREHLDSARRLKAGGATGPT